MEALGLVLMVVAALSVALYFGVVCSNRARDKHRSRWVWGLFGFTMALLGVLPALLAVIIAGSRGKCSLGESLARSLLGQYAHH